MINEEIKLKVELIGEEQNFIIYNKEKDVGEIYFNYKPQINDEVVVSVFICFEYYEDFKNKDMNIFYALLSQAIKYNDIFLKGNFRIELSTGEDIEVLEVGEWKFVGDKIEFIL